MELIAVLLLSAVTAIVLYRVVSHGFGSRSTLVLRARFGSPADGRHQHLHTPSRPTTEKKLCGYTVFWGLR